MVEYPEIADLLKKAETDVESFRAEATAALDAFTLEDRELVKNLLCDAADIETVLELWAASVRPERERLLTKRRDRVFRATLRRNIGFSDEQARAAIEHMIDERLEKLVDETVDALYPLEEGDPPYSLASQRSYALHFLTKADEELEDFRRRYHAYVTYRHVAHAHAITLCDSHASWLERQRSALQIRRERHHTREEEAAREATIRSELEALAATEGGLVTTAKEWQWDGDTLLALRTKYEKRLATAAQRHVSPTRQLKIFDDVVRAFRDKELEKVILTMEKPDLETVRQLSERMDAVLLRFFQLGDEEKTHTLTDMQRYHTLHREKTMIELIRKNRTAFQKRQAHTA